MTQPMPRMAVQLYTLRSLDTLDAILSAAAAAGYDAVETVGTHDLDAAALKEKLEQHHLSAISSHVMLDALEGDLAGLARFYRDIGTTTLVVPWVSPDTFDDTPQSWTRFGARLGELGRRARDEGVRLGYHNHQFEMRVVEGRLGLDWIIEGAESGVFLEPDLAWIAAGGADPAAFLARHAGHCPLVHVKDLANPGEGEDEGGLADVGHGRLDWTTLLRAAKDAGAEYTIVEHDHPKDPAASVQRSARFLRDALSAEGGDLS